MRLLDRVFQAEKTVMVETPDGVRRLPGARALAERLSRAPLRFACDASATAAVAAVALDFPFLSDCMDLVRFPAPDLWVEWEEDVRRAYFAGHGIGSPASPADAGQRVGLLVRSDADARRIEIESCWTRPQQDGVELSPVVIEFDLAQEASPPAAPDSVSLAANDYEAANALLARAQFRLRPEWRAYYAESGPVHAKLVANANRVAFDANMALALALLLASREPLRRSDVRRGRLNKGRVRRGRPALLDHVELTMALGPEERRGEAEAKAAADRSASRLHFVRAHLVRRGHSIFWRRAHTRGRLECGPAAARTIMLRGR